MPTAWTATPTSITRRRRPHHREFPAGYSSAGCSPAEPASASPTAPVYVRRPSWHNPCWSTCPHFFCLTHGVQFRNDAVISCKKQQKQLTRLDEETATDE